MADGLVGVPSISLVTTTLFPSVPSFSFPDDPASPSLALLGQALLVHTLFKPKLDICGKRTFPLFFHLVDFKIRGIKYHY